MARSSYKSENLTGEQLKLVQLLNENEIEYFLLDEIEELVNRSFKNIGEVVENLADKKILTRLERAKYANINFNNQNVIGTFISQNSAVSYWSALSIHGLTSRFPNKVFIQTTKRKRDKTILGVDYKFVTIPERKRSGITTLGYGNNSYPITDTEKTIIDCFDLQKYSGGFDLLISAFSEAKLISKKMIEYAEAINNISAIKRMGFLSELLKKKRMKEFSNYAKTKVNKKYTLIDSAGEDNGEFVADWRVRLNVSRDEIMNLSKEIY